MASFNGLQYDIVMRVSRLRTLMGILKLCLRTLSLGVKGSAAGPSIVTQYFEVRPEVKILCTLSMRPSVAAVSATSQFSGKLLVSTSELSSFLTIAQSK